ncbi:MAG: YkgJ family cysteine cluster protein, partial [Leptospiraceae bacterium]|nr:YkgJ family cysteine cluster protein [Leptospiraceae bacterium]
MPFPSLRPGSQILEASKIEQGFQSPGEIVRQVLEVYSRIDESIETFCRTESFRCPPGCGKCCENPGVEATVLEILPLAWFFYESDQAEHIYDQIQHQDQNHHTHCVHYLPDPFIEGNGRCQVYENRPFLCRMFGFSTRYDKVGSPVA